MKYFLKINCKEATYLISKKQESKISFIEKVKLKWHIKVCACCNLFNKQMQQLMDLLKVKPKKNITLSSFQKEKMNTKIQTLIESEKM